MSSTNTRTNWPCAACCRKRRRRLFEPSLNSKSLGSYVLMQLGFVSAILPDLTLEEVLAFAADEGFACVELMCWPPGAAERRYAGVTHLDVSDFTAERAAQTSALLAKYGVAVSGLGYYPNPLDPDPAHRAFVIDHLKKVIDAAKLLTVPVVNTFVGRDPTKSVEENWPLFLETWPDI